MKTKIDILYDRIGKYYIKMPYNIKLNDIEYILHYIEQSLKYMYDHLYDTFYQQKFVYKIIEQNTKEYYVIVQLIKDYNINNIKNNMFIVNN